MGLGTHPIDSSIMEFTAFIIYPIKDFKIFTVAKPCWEFYGSKSLTGKQLLARVLAELVTTFCWGKEYETI